VPQTSRDTGWPDVTSYVPAGALLGVTFTIEWPKPLDPQEVAVTRFRWSPQVPGRFAAIEACTDTQVVHQRA
jgi:hypothetical protein